ncbi:hypothetical protein GCM10027037_20220 [Mucilaginibacter koreensis]
MTDNFNHHKQKSPKRRFLFILGGLLFISIVILGIMIMFWSKLPLHIPQTQRYAFGGLFIIYGVLRFIRIVSRNNEE